MCRARRSARSACVVLSAVRMEAFLDASDWATATPFPGSESPGFTHEVDQAFGYR